jgi:branched-chain amino acid transport system substrate-binding protein
MPTNEGARRRAWPLATWSASAAVLLFLALLAAARAQEPIKIGVLLPLTGNFAVPGQQTLTGLKMYFDEVGNKAGGHPLEIIVEDTQTKPDVAIEKARKLVERDGAQVLTGIVGAAESFAVNDYSRQNKVPLVISGDAGQDELTLPGAAQNPYLVRFTFSGRTGAAAAAGWAYKKGWRKVAMMAADYAGGADTNFEFARAFCRLGGTVAQVQWPQFGTTDFGPYLTGLDRSVDALFDFEPGADGLRFLRQYVDFGLKGKIPVFDIWGTVVFEPYLAQTGDAALGMYSSEIYTPMLKTPENERFVAAFQKRMNGALPEHEAPNGYVGAHAIVDAIDAVKGDLSDKMKFVAALRAVDFSSPKGDIKLDKYGNVIQSIFIREAENVDGRLGNVPIATYANVDQFWPFTEAEYESFKLDYVHGKGAISDCTKLLAKK